MATVGRKTLPASFRAPPRNPAEAKARAAKDALAPQYAPADLELPPAMLHEGAAAIWQELAPVLTGKGVVTDADVTCLSTICEILSDIREYQKTIRFEGAVLEGAKGSVKHPLISPLGVLRSQLRSYLCEIGWTPGSRTKVTKQGAEDPVGTDPLDDLLSGGVN